MLGSKRKTSHRVNLDMLCVSHCECEPLSLAVPLHMWLLQCVVHVYIHTYVHMNYIAYIIIYNTILSCNSPTYRRWSAFHKARCEYAVIGLLASYSRSRARLKEPRRRSAVNGAL